MGGVLHCAPAVARKEPRFLGSQPKDSPFHCMLRGSTLIRISLGLLSQPAYLFQLTYEWCV